MSQEISNSAVQTAGLCPLFDIVHVKLGVGLQPSAISVTYLSIKANKGK
jgi:hypothetical protein